MTDQDVPNFHLQEEKISCWTCLRRQLDEWCCYKSGHDDVYINIMEGGKYPFSGMPYYSMPMLSDSTIQQALDVGTCKPGYYSTTYQITISDVTYAFKKWNPQMKEYLTDKRYTFKYLLSLKHDNLRMLHSYHPSLGGLLLEYLPFSLRELLITSESTVPRCLQRLIILKNIIDGLAFLHDCQLVHNNLTSKNILLDETLKAKLSDGCLDYNLHKMNLDRSTFPIPCHVGKIGYSCQDALAGIIRKSNDIYSFGAICLEITSGLQVFEKGRRPPLLKDYLISSRNQNWKMLKDKRISWKMQCTKSTFCRPRKKILELAVVCLSDIVRQRPAVIQVQERLEALIVKSVNESSKLEKYVPV
ncbi:Interleukin-1 receptor-associated kinase 4 [Trichoplax sp. H2]|nr:Interleukin-1 receptor-associated kinase 4 [Trichoplax sp. H2]|eukprot:RDD38883.1 Interleukin-1 receptor-associated kinase 4 [Trichoplax sp. H2]